MEKKIIAALNKVNTGEKKYTITEKVVWNYFYTYQKLMIDPVGKVTVAFMPPQNLMFCITLYKEVQGWEESPAKAAWLKYLAQALNIMFAWLQKELRVGSECKKGGRRRVFHSPTIEAELGEGKPDISAICTRAGRKALRRGRQMLFQPLSEKEMAESHEIGKEEMLTLDNVFKFCKVLERLGRLSQEGTIDSAKDGNPPAILKETVRTYVDMHGETHKVSLMAALTTCKLSCRKSDVFGIQLNFETEETEVLHNQGQSYESKGKFQVADLMDKIRREALDEAIPVDVAKAIFSMKQELPEEQAAICSRMANGTHAAAVRVFMGIYRNIRDTQNADIWQALEDAGRNPEAQAAGIRVAKEQAKIAYSALSNTVRSYFNRYAKMSHEQMVQLVLGVTLRYMGKEAKRPSSFAGIILAEEFFEYIMSLYPENEEFAFTCDDLAYCEAEDGEIVEFIGGVVPGRAIFSRERNAIPDGVYTVRKEGKHAWVEASVRDRLEARLAESYEDDVLIVQTDTINSGAEADRILEVLQGAKEVSLARQVTINGEQEWLVILADGKPLTKFQSSVKKMEEGEDGELKVVKSKGLDKYELAQTLARFYDAKAGEVSFAHKLAFGEKRQYAVVIALKNVKTLGYTAMQKILTEVANTPVENWMQDKPVQRTCGNRLADMKARAAKMNVEEKSSETVPPVEEAPKLTIMQRLMAKKRNKVAEEPVAEKKPSRLARLRKSGASIQ